MQLDMIGGGADGALRADASAGGSFDLRLPLLGASPLDRDPDCRRCRARERARSICLDGDGPDGGLLVVGEAPGPDEDAAGKPFVGRTGQYVRPLVEAQWRGPVRYTNAVRCLPPGGEVGEDMVEACRGYLRAEVARSRPTRVLAVGATAAASFAGVRLPPLSVRRAYSFLDGVPVLFLIHPAAALRNRHVKRMFEEDLRWSLRPDAPRDVPAAWTSPATPDEAVAAIEAMRARRGRVSFDVEYKGRPFLPGFRLLSIAFSDDGQTAVALDAVTALDPRVAASVRALLEDVAVAKVGQVVKGDVHAVHAVFGADVAAIDGDTRAVRKLLESEDKADLDVMSWLVGMGGYKRETRGASDFSRLDRGTLLRRNAGDAIATARLDRLFEARLRREPDIARTYRRLTLPAIAALVRVERWGVAASRGALAAFRAALEEKLAAKEAQLLADPAVREYERTRGRFNLGSPPQLAVLLYDVLGLDVGRTTDKGHRSTDEDALEALAPQNAFAAGVLEWRGLDKLRGTYAVGLEEHIAADGRIHATYNADGARTGRLSAAEPNLQQIPRPSTPFGQMSRNAFVAPPGAVLLKADYAQLELRIAAMLSQDPVMIADFKAGVDIHRRSAAEINRALRGGPLDMDGVTAVERQDAKSALSFGALYGKTAEAFARERGIAESAGRAVYAAIFGRYAGLERWTSAQWQHAQATGEVWTEWEGRPARRRQIIAAGDTSRDRRREGGASPRNQSINSPVQGTANDYCLASLIECVRRIEDERLPAKVVLTVHDELVFEIANRAALGDVAGMAREVMEGWPSRSVPLVVDMSVGDAWGSTEHYAA